MKRILIILLLVAAGSSAYANHLKGGFFTYEYLGKGIIDTNKLRYTVTLTIYMQCEPTTQQQDASVPFTFFDASTHQQITNPSVALSSSYNLYRGDNQCIADEKTGCIYHVRVYTLASVELAPNAAGYIIAFQRCCRIGQIVNVPNPSNQYGSTYSINIPGTNAGPTAFNNKSAAFLVNDTAVVCGGSYFQVPFIAFDNDSTDQLQYSFCDAYIGGGQGGGSNPAAASSPPYSTLPYSAGFSGNSPLGPSVTIDPQTGVISGIAPDASGEYVITVCITEFRGGIPIATTRKELHINVGSCTSADAELPVSA